MDVPECLQKALEAIVGLAKCMKLQLLYKSFYNNDWSIIGFRFVMFHFSQCIWIGSYDPLITAEM